MVKYIVLLIVVWFSLRGMDLKEQQRIIKEQNEELPWKSVELTTENQQDLIEVLKTHFETSVISLKIKTQTRIMDSEKALYDEKDMKNLFDKEQNISKLLCDILDFQIHQCQGMIDEVVKNSRFSFFIADYQNHLLDFGKAKSNFINIMKNLLKKKHELPSDEQYQTSKEKKVPMMKMVDNNNIWKMEEENNKKTAI